ncbi:endonuclease domain-containing protein [Sphingosinicella terrae]|uniref:endonuclease domain-containing protein n=1 Tax=Sphingosinicella terrae TaxID=2172047 RepID=UPI000E0D0BED|nr:DUF559 domain-containing protein [Sphingosinicella terrae]
MHNYALQPSGTVSRARELRRNETAAEKILRRALRTNFPGAKFRRQVPFGPYFIDFLSFSSKLIVEVDGSQHAEAVEYDTRRTTFLSERGYRVRRFWNNEVLENLDGVLTEIGANLSPSPSHAAAQRGPLPLPVGEGNKEF